MRVVVFTPPAPVVTTAEAKAHLRVDGADDDTLIDGLVAAATAHIDGPMGWLGRAIGLQTLDAWFDHFGAGQFALPYPPIVEVLSVKYLEPAAGVETTIAPGQYEMIGNSLASAYGATWPTPRYQREAVRVRYRAGYGEVPAPIKVAVLLMVGRMYEERSAPEVNGAAKSLLQPFRVFM